MDKTCATCDWWEDGVCTNDESDVYQTGEAGNCPCWENYDLEMWGEE